MKLIRPGSIPEIDAHAIKILSLDEETLIRRAGNAVADAILARYKYPKDVLVLCGGGNNGADGYATALALRKAGVNALAADVFDRGQRSEGGKAVLLEYTRSYGPPLSLADVFLSVGATVIVDAVLGSGAKGPLTDDSRRLLKWLKKQPVPRVAVDIPLGVDADLGEAAEDALPADLTVVLSFYKRGLLSYPARGYCGELLLADIGIGQGPEYDAYISAIGTEAETVKSLLPERAPNSHKGTFGLVHAFAGSKKMRGAAHLAALAALRMGVGLMKLSTEEEVVRLAGRRLPELLFDVTPPLPRWTEEEMLSKIKETDRAAAILIGPGVGVSDALYRFLSLLASQPGPPLILDADALGAIAAYALDVDAFFSSAKRPLILTPHPLEFARLVGRTAAQVQSQRMRLALCYAKKWRVFLLLKGACTVITDGDRLYINTTGSTALAKGGSGDVLSGAVSAFVAEGAEPLSALAIAAYLHGAAGDSLAREVSEYGVLPSDLPLRMAQLINTL